MNFYETLYIVHPALEAGRLKDIILSLEESLKKFGGKTLSIDLWGKKKLAYIIDKQKYGTYVQLQFKGEGNCTSSFGMELEHNPDILSYLTTLIKEFDVVEQKNDLDTQIAGHSREVQKIDRNSDVINDKDNSKDKPATKETNIIDQNTKSVAEEEQKIDRNSDVINDKDNSKDKPATEETNIIDQNTKSVAEEEQKNIDKTDPKPEEEQ